jgi:hypothetical protein
MAAVMLMSSMVLMRLRHSMTAAVHRVQHRRESILTTGAHNYARELLRSIDFDRTSNQARIQSSKIRKETSK